MTKRGRGRYPATPEGVAQARQWFATKDASIEGVASWDVKTEQMVAGILGVLASGCAIMLGTTMSGTAVSVTIYDGDAKQRTYATDSIELDDIMDALVAQTRPKQPIDISHKTAGTGD